jgi:hypothetical protein
MTALMWLQYIAAGLVFLFAISLTYWAYREFVDRDPLGDVDNEPWFSWLLLIPAVLGIEVPFVATLVVIACSVFAGTLAWQLGVASAASAFTASMLYLAADARAHKRMTQRHLAAKPKR